MLLVILGLAWLWGVVASGVFGAPWWIGGVFVALLVPLGVLQDGRRGAGVVAVAALLTFGGAVRYDAWADRGTPALARLTGQEVVVEGRIDSEPEPSRSGAFTSYVVAVDLAGAPGEALRATDGRLRMTLNQYAEHLPGDRVRVTGELEEPPVFEDFDYRAWLAQRDIVGTMFRARVEVLDASPPQSAARLTTDARLKAESALQRSLPEPEASLAAGIAFGRDDNLPEALEEDFRDAGLAHLLAVSGSNVALVSALVFWAMTKVVGRRYAVLPAVITVIGYMAMAGFSASVVRASVMAGIYLAGLAIGRPQSGLPALAAAALLMTAYQPSAAADAGFQLSLAATAGLVVFEPWVRYALEWLVAKVRPRGIVPYPVIRITALSVSAWVATLPLVWVHFGRVSIIGIVANVIAEPIFALSFWASLLTAGAGLAWEPAGWAVGLLAYYPLAFIALVGRWSAAIPGAAFTLPSMEAEWVVVCYALLGVLGWFAYRRFAPRASPIARDSRVRVAHRALSGTAYGVFAAAVLVTTILPMRGPGQLRIDVLDVGQGDAILITTPGGQRLLIDSGPSGIGLARELSAVLPHWERGLEMVVLTHPQEDHVAGFPAFFERYDAALAAGSGASNRTIAAGLYAERAGQQATLAAGDSWHMDGVDFEVLWPPADFDHDDLNAGSVVLRVTFGETVVLLTGDIEAAGQRELMALGGIEADVLKVPHHGSKTSDPDFFAFVGAALAVISSGSGNQFGHPAEETLDALADTHVLRTDTDGRVTIRSDGRRISYDTER